MKCRDCGTPIKVLRRTDTGRTVALDPHPHPLGRVVIRPALGGPMADVRPFPLPDGTGHRFHTQTCPGAR